MAKDNAAPPFATRDGRPVDPSATVTRGADFTKNPIGDGTRSPPPSPWDPSQNPKPDGGAAGGALYGAPNRAQATAPEERTNPEDAGERGGASRPIVDAFDPGARGTGSVGTASVPFAKLK